MDLNYWPQFWGLKIRIEPKFLAEFLNRTQSGLAIGRAFDSQNRLSLGSFWVYRWKIMLNFQLKLSLCFRTWSGQFGGVIVLFFKWLLFVFPPYVTFPSFSSKLSHGFSFARIKFHSLFLSLSFGPLFSFIPIKKSSWV